MRPDSRDRCLMILRILRDKTDENHHISRKNLKEILVNEGYESGDKGVINDIASLTAQGWPIEETRKNKQIVYYLRKAYFDIAEAKLIIDAIQAAKFIPLNESIVLINKVCNLTSDPSESLLRNGVRVLGRNKSKNGEVMSNIEHILKAIDTNKKISFQYYKWNDQKVLVSKDNGDEGNAYIVSPYLVCINSEQYYMIAWSVKHDEIRHYRIDKMRETAILDDSRFENDVTRAINPVNYADAHFGMFGGKSNQVVLGCDSDNAGFLIDRFGPDCDLHRKSDHTVFVRVQICVSPLFFGWLDSFEGKIWIERPKNVLQKYHEHLNKLCHQKSDATSHNKSKQK